MSDKVLSHIDKSGMATMVDVSTKQITHRTAIARSIVVLPAGGFRAIVRRRYSNQKRFSISNSHHRRYHGCQKNRGSDTALSSAGAG